MEKLNRWIAKHAMVVYAVSAVLAFVAAMVAIDRWYGPWALLIYLLLFGWIFLSSRFILNRGGALLKAPLDMLMHRCDPYPYLEEAREQMDYAGNWNMKLSRIITLALALCEVGEYEQMGQLLLSVSPEMVAKAHPANQAIYYSLLCNGYARQKKTAEMEMRHNQFLEAYQSVHNKKHKVWLEPRVISHYASYHFARQEYSQALQFLEKFPDQGLRDRVVRAYSLARIYATINETEKAMEQLEFVINNGNQLYIVTEAKALLAKIKMEESI